MQLVNALSAQTNRQPTPVNEQAASTGDFKTILTGQQSSTPVEETTVNPTQTRLMEEKQIVEATGLEGLLNIPEAIKLIAKEWMADGKQPSFEELAAFLGMSTEQLQKSIQDLTDQLTALASTEKAGALPVESAKTVQSEVQKEDPPIELVGEEGMNALLQAIQLLAAVPSKEWPTLEEKAVQTVLQAGKLWQLLGEKADSQTKDLASQAVLKTMMKEVAGKLEKLLAQPQSDNRAAILQKAFQSFLQPSASNTKLSSAHQSSTPQQELMDKLTDGQAVQKTIALLPGKEGTTHIQPFFHPLGRTETFSMSVQTNPRPMNMEQFMEKFSQILGNSNLVKMPNGTKLLLRLYPEQLGSLRIELLQQNGVMTAKILSSTPAVKELFEQHVSSLKHAFSQQNVAVDKIELTFSQAEPQKFDRQQQQQHEQSRQPQQEAKSQETDDEPTENFQDLLLNMEV
ncbi:flagellar hook-length control protein FliK [Bacillus sp. FJAT-27231]|uniref:flagellar hook-length control protein FliK n=1 Tax=Bacillus sp. FJAT-27231 TaxID=1679168 RepID=UPI001E4F8CA9|nr:flagellar hook-length control protein FliK [Bacillus sp. FJAT-27231]